MLVRGQESTRCRPPHVNADNLRDELFQSEAPPPHESPEPAEHRPLALGQALVAFTEEGELLQWVRDRNAALAETFSAELKAGAKKNAKKMTAARKKALEKAHANGFFLGMDSQWFNM